MIITDRQEELGRWMADRIGGTYTDGKTVYIGYTKNDQIVCGTSFSQYNGKSITVEMAVDNKRLNIVFLKFSFWYPFCQIGVNKLIAMVDSSNLTALKLDKHMGFVEEGRIKDAAKGGDLIILTMTREQCKYI